MDLNHARLPIPPFRHVSHDLLIYQELDSRESSVSQTKPIVSNEAAPLFTINSKTLIGKQ